MPRYHLGDALQVVRKQHGYSAQHLARKMNRVLTQKISPEFISRIEHGAVCFPEHLEAIFCIAMGEPTQKLDEVRDQLNLLANNE